MAVRGYVNKGTYFCINDHQANSDDEPLEEVPPDASCVVCGRSLNVVADEEARV